MLSECDAVVVFHRLGPYHHARLRAASKVCKLTAVELTSLDNTYAWSTTTSLVTFPIVTLFHADVEKEAVWRITGRICEVLKQANAKVVFVPGWGSRGALATHLATLVLNIPSVIMSDSTAEDARRRWWKEEVKRGLVSLCSAGIAAGRRQVAYLEQLGMQGARIFTGYDVIDNEHFADGAAKARRDELRWRVSLGLPDRYFLSVSRFVEEKNLPTLIRAYARYREVAGRNAWRLVMLGDGPTKPSVIRIIEKLRLEDCVVMPGFIQYDDLPPYYGLASVFVHASAKDTWALVVNEAMAAALPVIVSDRCGSVADLVVNGRNGFVCKPRDVEQLSSIMLRVATEQCDLVAMGQASREIIGRWSLDRFAEAIANAVEIASNTPRRRSLWARALSGFGLRR